MQYSVHTCLVKHCSFLYCTFRVYWTFRHCTPHRPLLCYFHAV